MEQSLEIQKRVLGDEHCDTLWSMNILANSYLKLDRIQETLGLTQLVLGVQKRVLGDGYPDVFLSMSGLATSYSYLGQHQVIFQLLVIFFVY